MRDTGVGRPLPGLSSRRPTSTHPKVFSSTWAPRGVPRSSPRDRETDRPHGTSWGPYPEGRGSRGVPDRGRGVFVRRGLSCNTYCSRRGRSNTGSWTGARSFSRSLGTPLRGRVGPRTPSLLPGGRATRTDDGHEYHDLSRRVSVSDDPFLSRFCAHLDRLTGPHVRRP